jgi:hypothetical protein
VSFSHVQDWGAQTTGTATSLTATSGSAATAGDLVVVHFTTLSGQSVSSVADNAGNTYTLREAWTGSGNWYLYIYSSVLTTGSSGLAVTVTLSLANYLTVGCAEFSFSGTLSVDGTPTAQNSNSSTPSSGSITLSATDLFVGCCNTQGSGHTCTAGTAFTLGYTGAYSSGVSLGLYTEYNLADANSSDSASFSASGSGNWNAAGCAFKASGGGGGGFTPWIYGDQIQEMYG